MRYLFLLALIVISPGSEAASCCAGGGPRSFVQLNHLQNYEWAISSSFKDRYGRYTPYGEFVETERLLTTQVAFGVGIRILEDLEWGGSIPFVHAERDAVGGTRRNTGLGDIGTSVRFHVLDSFYDDDWYPDVKLMTSVNAPTGSVEQNGSDGTVVPGTGTGYWEFGLSAQLQRDFGWILFDVTPSYFLCLPRDVSNPFSGLPVTVREGDKIQIAVSGTLPVGQRLSLSLGASQAWTLDRTVGGQVSPDSNARVGSFFGGVSYFISRFWVMSLTADASFPWERGGMNESAYRSITLNTNYAVY